MPTKARVSSADVTKSTSFLTCLAYRCVSRAMRSNMTGVKSCSNSWVGVSSDNLVLSSDFILSGAEPGRLDDVYFGMHFFHTELLIMFVSLQLIVLVLVGLLAGICMFDGLGSRHCPARRFRGRPTLGCVHADGCVVEAAHSTVTGCSATVSGSFSG